MTTEDTLSPATQPPTPPQPPAQQAKKRWYRRHPIWAGALAVLTGGIGLMIGLIIVVAAALNAGAHQVMHANSIQSATSAPAAANSPAPAPAPTGPTRLAVGQPAMIADSAGNPEGSVTVQSVHVTTQPADSFGSAPANGYYVIVKVSATADQAYTQGYDVNALDFYALSHRQQFQEGNGNAFDALSNNQSGQDITATLGAGQTATGWEAFDVAHPHGVIVYAPNLDGQPLAEWRY